MKATTAYERKGQIFLHASSKTTAGVWVISEPISAASKDDPVEIGRLALASLRGSTENAPHPKAWTNLFDPVLALAGVKSLDTFIKGAKCVEIELDGGQVKFIPTRNEGVEDGFAPLPERTRSTLESDERLGAELLAALAVAE
jgi:hypothetical protein